jgi:hypothetical protein
MAEGQETGSHDSGVVPLPHPARAEVPPLVEAVLQIPSGPQVATLYTASSAKGAEQTLG